MEVLQVSSRQREELVEITGEVERLIERRGWSTGALLLYTTHTTAGVTINEAADPSVARDLVVHLGKAVPRSGDYRHMEGNSDAHIKSTLVGCSECVPVERGRMQLGTWQGIFFAEFDGPRSRKVLVQWLRSGEAE
jgi:secondary thiamine-phosphate synthase enzyme